MRRASDTILVVDDEEVMRDVLQTLLTQAGYRVTLAADGAAGPGPGPQAAASTPRSWT